MTSILLLLILPVVSVVVVVVAVHVELQNNRLAIASFIVVALVDYYKFTITPHYLFSISIALCIIDEEETDQSYITSLFFTFLYTENVCQKNRGFFFYERGILHLIYATENEVRLSGFSFLTKGIIFTEEKKEFKFFY